MEIRSLLPGTMGEGTVWLQSGSIEDDEAVLYLIVVVVTWIYMYVLKFMELVNKTKLIFLFLI